MTHFSPTLRITQVRAKFLNTVRNKAGISELEKINWAEMFNYSSVYTSNIHFHHRNIQIGFVSLIFHVFTHQPQGLLVNVTALLQIIGWVRYFILVGQNPHNNGHSFWITRATPGKTQCHIRSISLKEFGTVSDFPSSCLECDENISVWWRQ